MRCVVKKPSIYKENRGRMPPLVSALKCGIASPGSAEYPGVCHPMRILLAALLPVFAVLSGCEKPVAKPEAAPMSANTPKDESEMSSEEWDAAYDRISEDLNEYFDRVMAKRGSGQPMTGA